MKELYNIARAILEIERRRRQKKIVPPMYKDMPKKEMQQILELARSINEESELTLLIVTAAWAQKNTSWIQKELLSTILKMTEKHVSRIKNNDESYSENPRFLYLACILVALLRTRKIKSLDVDSINALDDYKWDDEFFHLERKPTVRPWFRYSCKSLVPAEHVLNLAQSINRDAELVMLLILAFYGEYEEEWDYEEMWEEIHKRVHKHIRQLGYDYPCEFLQLAAAYGIVGSLRIKGITTIDMAALKDYAENKKIGEYIVFNWGKNTSSC